MKKHPDRVINTRRDLEIIIIIIKKKASSLTSKHLV